MHSRDKEIVKLPNIWPQLGRRGIKPTTRTRAQNQLPEFFEVAKRLYNITLFQTYLGIYMTICINNV